mmetsp:Transcript_36182/g.84756  ORF Transcript_36182/g.84756 Transcript_36182/m.84756 type:complete len:222 (+) Transcript_36182:157-822(+)
MGRAVEHPSAAEQRIAFSDAPGGRAGIHPQPKGPGPVRRHHSQKHSDLHRTRFVDRFEALELIPHLVLLRFERKEVHRSGRTMQLHASRRELFVAHQVISVGIEAVEERPGIHGINFDGIKKCHHVLILEDLLELRNRQLPEARDVDLFPHLGHQIFEALHVLHHGFVVLLPRLYGTVYEDTRHHVQYSKSTESDVEVEELDPENAQRKQRICGDFPVHTS